MLNQFNATLSASKTTSNPDAQAASPPKLNIEDIPLGPLGHIASFLSPEATAALDIMLLGRIGKLQLNESLVWESHLNSLKDIDKNLVETLNPEASFSWRFGIAFEQINQSQIEEITHFIKKTQSNEIDLPHVMRAYLLGINEQPENQHQTLAEPLIRPSTSLQTLQDRHLFLNRLNAHLIRSEIDSDPTGTELDIAKQHLTRFPEELFEVASLQNYWSQLQQLNCGFNQLKALPESLGKCTTLIELNCVYNQLQVLPESLGKCTALTELMCYHNLLNSLPDSLGSCSALTTLWCYDNELQTLPQSIGNCQKLTDLDCHHNQLQALPAAIRKNFSALYCERELATQRTPSSTQAHSANSSSPAASSLNEQMRRMILRGE